jgi:DNA repair and recombination RAD54-like protein
VVCPSSLVTNWANEFDKWLGKASQPKRVVVQKGGQEGLHQIKAWSNKASEVLIISYDLFRMNADTFSQVQQPVACLVVDEGHRLKNTAGSLTLTALESLPCQARLCITATPIQNNLSDFFTVANFVCPGLLGDLASFRREYDRPISASNNKNCSTKQHLGGLAASRRLDEITQTFMLRRLQKDILKTMLPPRTEVLLFCRPSQAQCNLYQQLTGSDRAEGERVMADALTTLIKLRKLCLHPMLLEADEAGIDDITDVRASGKVQVLDSLLQQIRAKAPSDKVVIVSNYTSALSMIERSILKPQRLTYLRLDGATDLKNRQSLVDTFNATSAERHFVFLLSSKAGGCGLNLIGANRLVMFDPDWK